MDDNSIPGFRSGPGPWRQIDGEPPALRRGRRFTSDPGSASSWAPGSASGSAPGSASSWVSGSASALRPGIRTGRPVVGVCAFYDLEAGTFIRQGRFFRALLLHGAARGMVMYVFAPGDVDWGRGVVRGVGLRAGGTGWRRGEYSLPDVVYNRIQTRMLEARPESAAALHRFARMPSVHLFNRRFLDKWEVHRMLQRTPAAADWMPPTERLTGPAPLGRLFASSDRLFVKPVDGSLGEGIAILGRERDGTYGYRLHTATGPAVKRSVPTIDALWTGLRPRLGGRRYIAQHDIGLARYRGRRFDVRLILQRDRRRRWTMAAVYARVARRGEYRTNVDAGATVRPWPIVLRGAFGRRAARVRRRIVEAAGDIAYGFDRGGEGLVGELAVDIGVDAGGRPWLIEVNSKPVRHIRAGGRPPRSLTTLLDYCTTLAGF